MTIADMRNDLANCEPYAQAPSWVDRVSKMRESQVIAIWKKFNSDGHFERSKEAKRRLQKKSKDKVVYHQMSMFEYMEDLPYADQ